MQMTPEHVALMAVLIALIFPPILSLILVLTPSNTPRFARGIAAVLMLLWAPLAYGAPMILAQLA